jgi:ribosomal protein L37AE/L43A
MKRGKIMAISDRLLNAARDAFNEGYNSNDGKDKRCPRCGGYNTWRVTGMTWHCNDCKKDFQL